MFRVEVTSIFKLKGNLALLISLSLPGLSELKFCSLHVPQVVLQYF